MTPKAKYILVGLTAGLVLSTVTCCGAGGLLLLASKSRGLQKITQRSATRDDITSLASMTCPKLLPDNGKINSLSGGEAKYALTKLEQMLAEAVEANTTVSPLAVRYQAAIENAKQLEKNAPSLEPFAVALYNTYQAGQDPNGAVGAGVIQSFVEGGKLASYAQQLEGLHADVLAVRIALAEAAAKVGAPEVPDSPTAEFVFKESGLFSAINQDTLFVTNKCGQKLTKAMLFLRLESAGGETLSNVYYVDEWLPGVTLRAVCQSNGPRETVSGVKSVTFRIYAAERTSKAGVWSR